MIQDIAPHHLDNSWRPEAKPQADSMILCFQGETVLHRTLLGEKRCYPEQAILSGSGRMPEETDEGRAEGCESGRGSGKELHLPRFHEFSFSGGEAFIYLFSLDGHGWFLMEGEPAALPEGYSYLPVHRFRRENYGPRTGIFAAITAYQLYHWYRSNRFCGACGHAMEQSEGERALVCPACGHVVYPRIVPAVIVGVRHEDRLLVTRYAKGFAHDALVAGFTEIGETLEETAAREVLEETGLRVRNIRYYKSQPWGIADDILAGFFCELDGSPEIHLDRSELKLAEWKTREEICLQPDDFSLTNEMMREFKEGRQ